MKGKSGRWQRVPEYKDLLICQQEELIYKVLFGLTATQREED
jgi:hypothetical protein